MSDQDEAGGGTPSPGPTLRGDDFVARLVSDPANPPRTTLLTGFLGASDADGHTRVYFDPELASYVDVANDDILHTEEAGGEGPLRQTLVWVKQDARARQGAAGGAGAQAGFLGGTVWSENAGGAAFDVPTAWCTAAPGCRETDTVVQGAAGGAAGPSQLLRAMTSSSPP